VARRAIIIGKIFSANVRPRLIVLLYRTSLANWIIATITILVRFIVGARAGDAFIFFICHF
tara:strand:- start:345 stop:527 length:183 start_codon:yes stop_codon:yes gene_type:complete